MSEKKVVKKIMSTRNANIFRSEEKKTETSQFPKADFQEQKYTPRT